MAEKDGRKEFQSFKGCLRIREVTIKKRVSSSGVKILLVLS